jgi:hypothetical protein
MIANRVSRARAINLCGGAMTSVCGVKVNAGTGLEGNARDNHGETGLTGD